MNVSPDLAVMEELAKTFPEAIGVNADQDSLETTARSVRGYV